MKNSYLVFIFLLFLSYYSFKAYSKPLKDQDCFVTKISSKLFDFNEFKIDTELNVSEFKVVNINSGKTIYKNGRNRKGIKNEYGYCRFELLKKGKKIYEFGHFKTNNWFTYSYTLKLKLEDGKISPSLKIENRNRSLIDYYMKEV